MIKNILYVEDGSVDVDELMDELGEETRIIVYRQGSKLTVLIQPEEPISTVVDDYIGRLEKSRQEATELIEIAMSLDSMDKVQNLLQQAYNKLRER